MDKNKVLDDIFNNDEFDILNVKPKISNARNAEERLVASFGEINDFFKKHNREPQPNPANISEYQLYTRLKGISGKNGQIDHPIPVQIDHLFRLKLTTQFRSKLTT